MMDEVHEQPCKLRKVETSSNNAAQSSVLLSEPKDVPSKSHHRTKNDVEQEFADDENVYIVRDALNTDELAALCRECDYLRLRYKDHDPLEHAAALDPFEYLNIPPTSTLRTNRERYIKERYEAVYPHELDRETNGERKTVSSNSTDESHNTNDSICRLLFVRLPNLLRMILGDVANETHVYLFNEHYVVKEPSSELAFRWHRDSDEQMPFIPDNERPRYFSCWCTLDDVDEDNGTLVIQSTGSIIKYSNDENALKLMSISAEPIKQNNKDGWTINAAKGTVVIFSGNKWHCSGVNGSDKARRVFYAQYSFKPITVGNRCEEPLAFAIPVEYINP